nr:MAG TPA: Repressor protein CI [Caudoviricetes sp.]
MITDEKQKKIFSSNLLHLLSKHNLTQKEVADKIGVSPQTFNTWCQGIAIPRMGKIQKLADYFNVNKSVLIDGTKKDTGTYNIEFIPDMTTTKIKVYGSVPAGVPVTAIEDIQGTVDIPSHWLSSGYDYMGIVVKGDSMFPKYQEGDIVVIRVQPDCENGQDCVVYINGDEATLKKVIKNSDCIILQPMNSEYTPIVVDYNSEDFKILGVVVQLVRYV